MHFPVPCSRCIFQIAVQAVLLVQARIVEPRPDIQRLDDFAGSSAKSESIFSLFCQSLEPFGITERPALTPALLEHMFGGGWHVDIDDRGVVGLLLFDADRAETGISTAASQTRRRNSREKFGRLNDVGIGHQAIQLALCSTRHRDEARRLF